MVWYDMIRYDRSLRLAPVVAWYVLRISTAVFMDSPAGLCPFGQTTGTIWAPKYYIIIPYKRFAPQTPLKKMSIIPKKFQAKAIQGHVPWLNLKKNFQTGFSLYANNVGTPLFRSMRQAQNTDTHTVK